MNALKCKMCGGSLEIPENINVGECPFCGTVTTFPSAQDEKKTAAFNMAEQYRQMNDFDKALGLYTSLISEYPEESEAYWGALLSKFGIEYVIDPTTGKRVPTCHRVQKTTIMLDILFISALRHASDSAVKALYKEQANIISKIQKNILSISAKEEPYDIFICYKESDKNGQRTKDSVLAADIYEKLTDKGYKVFFARITLEGKLGSAYEPIIFSALNTSPVMLVIGSCPEHFEAVWVKNEWSRFIQMQKQDKKKVLIPCYCDMSPYDLPDEIKMFQAQDMSKVGFLQDLIRGISKIIDSKTLTSNATTTVVENVAFKDIPTTIKKIVIMLEDGNFYAADELCNRILDTSPNNSKAYFYKMMADFRLSNKQDLLNCSEPLKANLNYMKALSFANQWEKEEYTKIETDRAHAQNDYHLACSLIKEGKFAEASVILKSIKNYRDSEEQLEYVLEQAYNKACSLKKCLCFKVAIKHFSLLQGYLDSDQQAVACEKLRRKIFSVLGIVSVLFLLCFSSSAVFIYYRYFNWSYCTRHMSAIKRSYFSGALILKKINEIDQTYNSYAKIKNFRNNYPQWYKYYICEVKATQHHIPSMLKIADTFINNPNFHSPQGGLKYLHTAAAAGSPQAMKLLADGYYSGKPATVFTYNRLLAMKFYFHLAECGDKNSGEKAIELARKNNSVLDDIILALAYSQGVGTKKNTSKAIEIFRKIDFRKTMSKEERIIASSIIQSMESAAKKNNSLVQHFLGECFFHGFIVPKNKEQAFYWYRQSALSGCYQAMYRLAECYRLGDGTWINVTEANKWAKNCFDALKILKDRDKEAIYYLSECYRNGYGTKSDIHLSDDYLKKSADAGYLKAMIQYGKLLQQNQKLKMAIKYFSNASAAGNVDGMLNMAYCFKYGLGVKRDISKAFRLYKNVAKMGDVFFRAQFEVATIYQNHIDASDLTAKRIKEIIENKTSFEIVEESQKKESDFTFSASDGDSYVDSNGKTSWSVRQKEDIAKAIRIQCRIQLQILSANLGCLHIDNVRKIAHILKNKA